MKKYIYKKCHFENLKFIMVHRIHKILVLLKYHLKYFKENIFGRFFKKYNILFFKKIFFITYGDGKSKA